MDDAGTALLVIDLQRDYLADDELRRCSDDIVKTVNGLVERARDAGVPVVDVRTVHRTDGSTWALNMRDDDQGMALEGSEGVEPIEGLLPGDVVVEKTRDSAFHGTGLDDLLRERGITHLVLAGISTESCIYTTAADAYAHDYRVTLVEDGTASVKWEEHDHALSMLQGLYRQRVARAAEIELPVPEKST